MTDTSLYSRQLYAIGVDAMDKIVEANVLICGMSGLGLEVAKCMILTGVKSVTLNDTVCVSKKDLISNYYCTDKDIGVNRAVCVKNKLKDLNPYVKIRINTQFLNEELIKKHQVCIVCDQFMKSQININLMARKYNTKYILANTIGAIGSIFCDFGKEFCVQNVDGETPKFGVLIKIENNSFFTNEPHGLYAGDVVDLVINNKTIRNTISKVINSTTFQTKHNNTPNKILVNSTYTQIKAPETFNFESLEKMSASNLDDSKFVPMMHENIDKVHMIHEFQLALEKFANIFKRLPYPWNYEDATFIIKIMNITSEQNEKIIRKLTYVSSYKCCPVDSIIGSIVCQEAVKGISKKYKPINQWLNIDLLSNILPDMLDEDKIDKYRIFGKIMQDKIEQSHIFIVGAGAIGCELLKNLALIGVKNITITDMDTIEKSNLNRQFLFRNTDIGKFKADCAKNAILDMKPDMKINVQHNKVCSETLNVYNEKFFRNVTCVMTALDNVNARNFVDALCLDNTKPMIDSGTLGTRGSVQSVIPHMTESYSTKQDPQEKEVPMCTLKNFPYLIEHCIQYARNLFDGLFVKAPQNYNMHSKNPEKIKNMTPAELSEIGNDILFVNNNKVKTEMDCIQVAYNLWYETFRDPIHHLLNKYPEDFLNEDGQSFWTGTKKMPVLYNFDNEKIHNMSLRFIESTANLWADVFKIKHVTKQQITQFLKDAKIPNISMKDSFDNSNDNSHEDTLKKISNIKKYHNELSCLEFEKDNDENFHIDFIASVANLRAVMYNIPPVDKFKIKGIAGKIIPAIITTTSAISGLATIEMMKVIFGIDKIEKYTSSFINLAIPYIGFTEPFPMDKKKIKNFEYSIWDKIEHKDCKLSELFKYVSELLKEEVSILTVTSSQYILFSTMFGGNIREKLEMKCSKLLEQVSGNKCTEPFMLYLNIDDDDNPDPLPCKIVM